MNEKTNNGFLTKVELQVEINRLQHGEDRRSIQDWAMIVGTHAGHLFESVLKNDSADIEKEILQIAAPLLEMYQELKINAS